MKLTALFALAAFAAGAAEDPPLGPKSLSYGLGLRVGGGYAASTPAQGLGVPRSMSAPTSARRWPPG